MSNASAVVEEARDSSAPPIDPSDVETIGQLGEQQYEGGIRERLEPDFHGQYVAINVQTGEYEVGKTLLEVLKRGIDLWPNANRYIVRVGYPAVARLGGAAWRPQ